MHNKTHERIIRNLIPSIDPETVKKINESIDTPQPWMPAYSPELGHVPGLSHRGHRKYGHDLLTAGIIGFVTGGPKGVAVAYTHLSADAGRDRIVEVAGSNVADVAEALLNCLFDLAHESKKQNNPRKRRSARQQKPRKSR